MLLETLNALNRAGIDALRATAGLSVKDREISLVREGEQVYPSLVTVRIKGSSLQMVHLGCDAELAASLATSKNKFLDDLAEDFLTQLLGHLDDRNPRGSVENSSSAPATLHTRGVRTFQFRLDTAGGSLFLLTEAPSRTEMAIVKRSDYLASMESIYLPEQWRSAQGMEETREIDDLLSFLQKTEADIYFETPAGDGTSTINSGILIEQGRGDDGPFLKCIVDFSDPALGVPTPGIDMTASVGIGDRSIEFGLKYLGPATHEAGAGGIIPCALFSLPQSVTIGQRRRTFRVPVSQAIEVELESAMGHRETSPRGDGTNCPEVIRGTLADLSFSGARIIAEHSELCSSFPRGHRVVCRLLFPEVDQPLKVMGIIRRSTAGPADRNQWQDELGLEFLISPDCDRTALDYIRQFVLQMQRSNLSQRLQVTGV